MKMVVVHNPYDTVVSIPKVRKLQEVLTMSQLDIEVHFVDFEQVRSVLPITTTPCVFLLFDELEGDFQTANLTAAIGAVKARALPKPTK